MEIYSVGKPIGLFYKEGRKIKMANKKYCVIRTDAMTATDVASALRSLRVYNDANEPIEVENGVVVELLGYEEGEREVMKAKLATAESKKEDCVIVATPEVMYDERKRDLGDFINEAGTICRGYVPHARDMYSITKEGFVGETVPAVGDELAVGENGKMTAGEGWGKVMAIETVGRYTYYVIKIA